MQWRAARLNHAYAPPSPNAGEPTTAEPTTADRAAALENARARLFGRLDEILERKEQTLSWQIGNAVLALEERIVVLNSVRDRDVILETCTACLGPAPAEPVQ